MIRRSASDRVRTSVIGTKTGSFEFDEDRQVGLGHDMDGPGEGVARRDHDQAPRYLGDLQVRASLIVTTHVGLADQRHLGRAQPDAPGPDLGGIAVASQDRRVMQLDQTLMVVQEVGQPAKVTGRDRAGQSKMRPDDFDRTARSRRARRSSTSAGPRRRAPRGTSMRRRRRRCHGWMALDPSRGDRGSRWSWCPHDRARTDVYLTSPYAVGVAKALR